MGSTLATAFTIPPTGDTVCVGGAFMQNGAPRSGSTPSCR